MTAIDTGICAPESRETLLLQQRQLVTRRRDVQMFPVGTGELPLPDGCARHANNRGVFHFRPVAITAYTIDALSALGRENEFLMLGPYSKSDIAARIAAGEDVTSITEYSHDGIEVRCAAATDGTLPLQMRYFEATKEPGSRIAVGELPERVRSAYQARH